ncbi:hypothetical protein [Candidatus Endomicrobiellum trichonymphae]|nr:hypothetical protein [Candidatus Endomicrobium trichonymphae]
MQNIIIIIVVVVAAVLMAKHLIKGSCNCCNNKGKKSSNCRVGCRLKK